MAMEASTIEQLVSNRKSFDILRLHWEPEQVFEISRAIRQNRTVRYVFLYDEYMANLSMSERNGFLKAICCLPKLESFVYISNGTRVKFSVIALAEILRTSKSLTTFELHGPNLSGSLPDFDAFNHSLGRLPTLKVFKLMPVFYETGHADLDPLIVSLSKIETLEELRLCFYCSKTSYLSTEHIKYLCHLRNLKVLDLRWPYLCDEHVTTIALELRDNFTVTELRIAGNDIVYGCFSLAEMLEVNDSIEIFSLACRGFGKQECCSALWTSFGRNVSMREITLENTETPYSGIFCCTDLMRRVLTKNNALVTLRLCNVGIDDDACIALSKALQMNSTLRHLDLRKGNEKVTNKGYQAFAEMLEQNYTLLSLDTNATGSIKEQIGVCLKLNKSARKLATTKPDRKHWKHGVALLCC